MRVGIAGLGLAARQGVEAFKVNPGARLTAVADVRTDALEEWRGRYGVETFTSVEAMCESPEVDAVWICTPNQLHSRHTIAAAGSGKHVICEKPMAVTLDEAEAMVDAIDRNGVKYVQGHSKIYDPPIRKMREIAASGQLGRIIQINTWHWRGWMRSPRLPSEVDSRTGGGVAYRQGPHQMDIVRFIGGGLVRSMRAVTGRYHPTFETEGDYTAFLEFEDHTAATVVLNGYGYFDITELTWGIGEGGSIWAGRDSSRSVPVAMRPVTPEEKYGLAKYNEDRHQERAQQTDRFQPFLGLTLVSCERGDIRQSPHGVYIYDETGCNEVICEPDSDPAGELRELVDSVSENRPSFPDARWGMATLEVVVGMMESSRQRQDIQLTRQVACPPIPAAALS
ncbi:MAG: hypothetical protein HW416_2082 [Chloroflexi bacterium]|nr:hypothetical protein [Chloroflexota bacterium]